MNWFEETFSYAFNQRALMGASMIGFLSGFFGGYIVLRRAALFAGALMHTLFPGIALGALIAGLNPLSALLGALILALVVGVSSQGLSRETRADLNTILAIFWTATFAAGLIILKRLGSSVSIDDYLFGNVLGISDADLWFTYGTGLVVLSAVIILQRPLLLMLFSPEVAKTQGVPVRRLDFLLAVLLVLTMVASLQAVGTLLALGLLVGPAAILHLWADSPRAILWGGGLLGAALSAACVLLSNLLDVQTGALIVIVLGLLFLASLLFAPRHGLLGSWRRHHIAPHG